jgi:hypothetical protein
MKTKLAILLISMLLVLPKLSISQDNKFIEISASDTVELKPLSYTYEISFKAQGDFMGIKFPMSGSDTVKPPSSAMLMKALKANNFTYELSNENDYTISNTVSNDTSLIIKLASESELKRLVKTMMPYKGISGKIKDTKYEAFPLSHDAVYKALYTRALSDATTIAKMSGNTVGKLISVEEPKDSFFDYISNLSDTYMKNIFKSSGNNQNKEIIKKLIFKFQMM